LALRLIRKYLVSNYDYGTEKVLVIGNDRITNGLIEEIKNSPGLGCGLLCNSRNDMTAVKNAVNQTEINEILLGEINGASQNILDLIDFCRKEELILSLCLIFFRQ